MTGFMGMSDLGRKAPGTLRMPAPELIMYEAHASISTIGVYTHSDELERRLSSELQVD